MNEFVASLTVVKVGREGLNFGTKREISYADLREHSRVRKEGTDSTRASQSRPSRVSQKSRNSTPLDPEVT